MKKIYPYVCMCLLALSPLYAGAQETGSSTDAATVAATPSPQAQERAQTLRSTLAAKKQTRITNLIANISNALDARTTRLLNITSRMERRAGKMETEGYRVVEARDQITLAKAYIVEIQNSMSDIDARVAATLRGEKPQEGWKEVRAELREMFLKLRDTKNILTGALRLLKEAQKVEGVTSTSTPLVTE